MWSLRHKELNMNNGLRFRVRREEKNKRRRKKMRIKEM